MCRELEACQNVVLLIPYLIVATFQLQDEFYKVIGVDRQSLFIAREFFISCRTLTFLLTVIYSLFSIEEPYFTSTFLNF